MAKLRKRDFGPETDNSAQEEMFSETFTTEDEGNQSEFEHPTEKGQPEDKTTIKDTKSPKVLKNRKHKGICIGDDEDCSAGAFYVFDYAFGFLLGLLFSLLGVLVLQRCQSSQKKRGALHGSICSGLLIYPVIFFVWVKRVLSHPSSDPADHLRLELI